MSSNYLRWKQVGRHPYPTHVHGGHTGQRYAVDAVDGTVQAKVDATDAAEMLTTGAYEEVRDESTIGRIMAAAAQLGRAAVAAITPVNVDQILLTAMRDRKQALRYVELLLVPLVQAAREGNVELRGQLEDLFRPVGLQWNFELPSAPDEEGLELAPAEKVTAEGGRLLEVPADNPDDPYGDGLAAPGAMKDAQAALATAYELKTQYKNKRPALVKAAADAGVMLPLGNETIGQIIGLMTGLGPDWDKKS